MISYALASLYCTISSSSHTRVCCSSFCPVVMHQGHLQVFMTWGGSHSWQFKVLSKPANMFSLHALLVRPSFDSHLIRRIPSILPGNRKLPGKFSACLPQVICTLTLGLFVTLFIPPTQGRKALYSFTLKYVITYALPNGRGLYASTAYYQHAIAFK